MRKTKIVCTLGPATKDKETIRQLAIAGMDIARLNFSHGTYEEHRGYFNNLREASRECKKPVGILQDLEGYKIRTGSLKGGKSLNLEEGDSLWLLPEGSREEGKWVSISYPHLHRIARKGDRVFVDDGRIELQIERVCEEKIRTKVVIGGLLGEHKGVHIPGVSPDFPSLTEKDKTDIQFGVNLGVDYIAQSFVRQVDDITVIRDVLKKAGREDIGVLAKIEDSRGVNNIDEIIEVADGVMIARGDMGVCLPRAEVPLIQKRIIRKCNRAGKPVITATQMLDSMIHNHHPTRAEVADVANAIFDGTDLVMLSGETATGSYPVQSVREMHEIAVMTENSLRYDRILQQRGILPKKTISDSIAFTTRELAELTQADFIMAFTLSGTTATVISKYRPRARILAVTPDHSVAKRLLLYWGVEVMMVEKVEDIEKYFEYFLNKAIEKGLIGREKLVVLTCGIKKEENRPSGTIKVLSTSL